MKTNGWANNIKNLSVSFLLGCVSAVSQILLFSFIAPQHSAYAQSNIVPDNTLGSEASGVIPNFNNTVNELITGGAQRGQNLFHSFQEFNVAENRGGYFLVFDPSIQNIFARVTGSNRSEILGTLGTFGNSNANLFLINPNGILFGKNARLDVGGSFVATTANAVQFKEQGSFSATNTEAPQLLTVNPSALFFNQINQNTAIQNNSVAPAGISPTGINASGLRVPDGKSLLLVGSDIKMDGGRLRAYGGRVELGGLSAVGNINLKLDGNNFGLAFPENITRANVSLNNAANINVSAGNDGNIIINAHNIDILQESTLIAGIGQGLGTSETVAGNIILNATGEINVSGIRSKVINLVNLKATGNGGNISFNADSFKLQDGAQILTSTFGQGNAGNVKITAKNAVSLTGSAVIYSGVEAEARGKVGNIDINAATFSLKDGSELQTITRSAFDTQQSGQEHAGSVNVKVSGEVDIAGVKNGFPSGIRTPVGKGAVGNGGNITIDAGSFKLRDEAQLSTSIFGQGNAGNVTVTAKDAISLENVQ